MRKCDVIDRVEQLERWLRGNDRFPGGEQLMETVIAFLNQHPNEYLQCHGVGPTGEPRCPVCGKSLGNVRLAWSEHIVRCVNCKTVFQDATQLRAAEAPLRE